MRLWWCIIGMCVLAACQPADESVAVENEIIAYGTEVAALRQNIDINRTQTIATIDASSTQAAAFQRYNRELVVTVQAGVQNPTPVRRVVESEGAGVSAEMFDLAEDEMRIIQIGAAADIDNNRCFRSHVEFFRPDVNIVYQTMRAINLQAGTRIRVVWSYEGQNRYETAYTAPTYMESECLALEMRSQEVVLSSGNWTATTFVNGEARDPTPFTISPG